MGGEPRAPLITVGIPLYKARPHLDAIVRNIESNLAPEVEFVLADQYREDGVLAELAERWGGEPRVRLLENPEASGWIGNYNFVVRAARGRFVRILTQDDRLPAASLRAVIELVRREPDVVLVLGREEIIDVDGRLIASADAVQGALWRLRLPRSRRLDPFLLYSGWLRPNANLPVVRREIVAAEHLLIPHTWAETGLSVRVWTFAIALRGRVVYLPEYLSQRCVHAGSFTSRHWRRSARRPLRRLASYCRAGVVAWDGWAKGTLARWAGRAAVFVCACGILPAIRIAERLVGVTRKSGRTGTIDRPSRSSLGSS